MKMAFSLFFLVSVFYTFHAQDCDYRYESSLIMTDNIEITLEQKAKSEKQIQDYLNCIQTTQDSVKLFWLNSRIAFNYSRLMPHSELVETYGLRAFHYNQERFCKDYVKLYVYHSEDSDFPMQRPYLDQIDTDEANEVKSHCLDNYKEAELESYYSCKQKLLGSKSSPDFNEVYFNALERIGENDQVERKKEIVNWDIQNQLDAANRAKLDELYDNYDFPTKELVSHKGLMSAFMILQHSKDCEWNEKWTRRFLLYKDDLGIDGLFSFYFFRNFNSKDGVCKDNLKFIKELKEDDNYKELLDFSRLEKQFNKEK